MAKAFRTYKNMTIPANGTISIHVQARYISCYAADANFQMALDDGVRFDYFAGAEIMLVDGQPDFQQIDLINDTGAPIDVSLAVGYGEFRDRRFSFSGTLATLEAKAATLPTVPDVTLAAAAATQIVAANAARREVAIANLTGDVIRVGDANVAAARGFEIAAGGSIILTTSAEVQGYSVAGGDVAVTEVRD